MKRSIAKILFAAALISLFPVGAAHADQNDHRLDTLFGELHKTSSQYKANEIVGEIWAVWTEYDNEDAHFEMLKGIEAMGKQQYETALTIFDHVVQNNPEFSEAWNKRATVYYLMGKFDESLSDVYVTLELEPRHFGALSGLGLIHMALGNVPEAIEAFEQALVTNPHMPTIQMRVEMLKEHLRNTET